MSSKINLQPCEYARKSSIFQDNQLIYIETMLCKTRTNQKRYYVPVLVMLYSFKKADSVCWAWNPLFLLYSIFLLLIS